ncbi:MAG: endonuclease/exonuclease/phosphatase family protein [Pseudomonadota bacterium]
MLFILRNASRLLQAVLAMVGIAFSCCVQASVEAATVLDDLDACSEALGEPLPAPQTETPEILRVLSWNTMKYGRHGARELLERLGRNVDFVFLQEGLRSVGPHPSFRGLRYFGDGYAFGDEQSGVELRGVYRAHLECSLSFTEPWLRSPKIVLATRHALGPQGLLLVNLHAVNFTLGVRAYAAQLDAVSLLLRSHGGPAIVAGDFNNWNDKRDATLRHFARKNGLAVADFQPDWRSRHLGRPVDGVLQRGFETLSATAVPTRVSDHHPLLLLLAPMRQP